jgi:hypothetical protein
LKDRAIYLAALLSGRSSLRAILGFTEEQVTDHWEAARRTSATRKREQRSIESLYIGDASGLPQDVRRDLGRWGILFHEEVHMSLHSFHFEGGAWIKGLRDLPAGPQKSELALATYMNRSAEVAWCLVRTLPILQPTSGAFGEDWSERWHLVDKNLGLIVRELATAKEIIPSLVQWIAAKFAFDPSWSFLGAPKPGG